MGILTHPVLSFIILLLIIVTIHEFGHFIFARLFNVKVEAFAIGFGKELIGFNSKLGTRIKLCMIPLGGYVKLYGHNLFLKKDLSSQELISDQAFDYKPPYQKIIIAAGGALFNFLLAIIIFSSISYYQGKIFYPPQVKTVIKDTPAYKAGINANDIIISIDDHKVENFGEIAEIINDPNHVNPQFKLQIKRDKKLLNFEITPIVQNNIKRMGIIAFDPIISKSSILHSINIGFKQSYKITSLVLEELSNLIRGKSNLSNLGGVISISDGSSKAMQNGLLSFIFFIAIFSINLGIINLLPIPGLDGGYIILYLLENFINRAKLTQLYYYLLQFGIFFLIFLMIVANLNDIVRFYNNN